MNLAKLWNQSTAILPEITLVLGILVILLLDLLVRRRSHGLFAGLALLFYVLALVAFAWSAPMSGYFFGAQIHADGIALFVRVLLLLIGIITVLLSYQNPEIERFLPAEYQLLVMGSVLGGMFMSLSASLLMVYLSIEFVSLLSYVLTAVKLRNGKAYEGAIKYLLFGGVSSGILLFGLSYIYGLGGSLQLQAIGQTINSMSDPASLALLLIGFVLVLAGLAYKIAVVPFHSWCPDVYEGAATPVTTFFSVGPKLAGFALVIRFFAEMVLQKQLVGFDPHLLYLILGIASALTMTLGNFAALRQNNIKRLLAYSSIAHAGYTLAGFSAYSSIANQAVLFYLFAYLIMNVGAFLVLMVVGTQREAQGGMGIQSFYGLAYRGTSGALWASAMTIFLFSLTGIPPFVGFIGKYYIFTSLIQGQVYWLAVIGVLNTVVSLYYYARIMKAMFFRAPEHAQEEGVELGGLFSPLSYKFLGVVLTLATLVFGVMPTLISLP